MINKERQTIMKRKSFGVIAVMLILAVTFLVICCKEAPAQQKNDVNKTAYFYQPVISKTYVNSQRDTSGTFKVGGASLSTFTITVQDSAAADIYVDTRENSGTTWGNVVTDSIITTNNAGNTASPKEIILRNAVTDNILGISKTARIRVAFRALYNGVTSASYSVILNWIP